MLYFAYGSNMDPFQMERRCPGAVAIGRARLPGHRLTFTWDSARWRGGVGHVIASDGDDVWGVLWDLEQPHLDALDTYEQIAQGVYRRENVVVEHDGVIREALIYLSNDDRARRPSRRYVRALVRGARAHDIPNDYIRLLRGVRRR